MAATPSARRTTARRLTPDEKDLIISLCLRDVKHKDIAKKVDCNPNTVSRTWRAWLKQQGEEPDKRTLEARGEIFVRLREIARKARALAAGDDEFGPDPVRALAEERQALMALAKLTGLDINRTELTGKNGGPITVTKPLDELLDRLDRLAPTEEEDADDED